MKDVMLIVTNKGFWLIALLCVLFYSAVFPFIKYATDLMVQKYNVDPKLAGNIPGLLPIGTIFLTPLFGTLYDRIGKGATLMIIGAVMLIGVHTLFALPILNVWWFATVIMIVLGIAFHWCLRPCGLLFRNYSGETTGYCLCFDFLGAELGIDGGTSVDRMGVEYLLQRSCCGWSADL